MELHVNLVNVILFNALGYFTEVIRTIFRGIGVVVIIFRDMKRGSSLQINRTHAIYQNEKI